MKNFTEACRWLEEQGFTLSKDGNYWRVYNDGEELLRYTGTRASITRVVNEVAAVEGSNQAKEIIIYSVKPLNAKIK